ncbi:transcriptional regulator with PAS, ATPase and Fis domain [Alkalispirillum mobile]|uniref:Transcriptional regulator with PAS, ATPase and Fis domain n=1 Tax=Alkalispirillum mobile TaxID=85925 RepID=A0A498BS74_9GAMM|nr:sigma 54-interacting transcriptional regulator [Alkalispirillum mobile]RLK46804.1 transcriptional regulator with PAS, ATPase and Fis domain [Alkalispirillum mobile]
MTTPETSSERPSTGPAAGQAEIERIVRQATRSLFRFFEEASAGAIVVDRDARVLWINDRYAELLGLTDPEAAVGQPVESVIPQSQLREVVRSGRPILLDIMQLRDQSLVVTRLPVLGEGDQVQGAVGFVLYDHLQPLTPLVAKFRRLQQDLARAQRALAKRRVRYDLSHFVGISPPVLEIKRKARLAAERNTPVLLLGETGTGKEILAQAIHGMSNRADQPFVGVSVAAIPENLLEAEFFGVAPGAYTGASREHRPGKFQLANGGTLFLDEVGDMPLHLQAKLLRALQEREVESVGSDNIHRVDVRVIAATSRDLRAMVEAGDFRPDLYYRLNVVEIRVPPLSERLEDVAPLCESILTELAEDGARRSLSEDALALLNGYHWPGNIRELRNILERAVTLVPKPRLEATDLADLLPAAIRNAQRPAGARPAVRPLAETLREAEAKALAQALEATGGNRSAAARLLGISRSVFYEKFRQLSGGQDMLS